MINKLIRQYGEHGNEYSPVEVGDKINEIIDWLMAIDRMSGTPPTVEEPAQTPEEKLLEIENNPWRSGRNDMSVARSTSTADRVYLIDSINKTKNWIKNPETLEKVGFKFSDVGFITDRAMDEYVTGEAIDLAEKKPLEVIKPIDGIDKYNL